MASRAFDLDRHPARDDAALRTVIEDAAMGRWEGARELLSSTGADWDRRIFRLQVLARGGVRLTFADTWAQAEPRSPHALALLANVLALRSMAGGRGHGLNEAMQEAWSTCDAAAEALPSDPSPYLVMLALTRFHSPPRDREWRATLEQVWKRLIECDPWNREAHHELLTYLFPSWHGTGGEVFHWAQEQCVHAPRGLPLHMLLGLPRRRREAVPPPPRLGDEGGRALGAGPRSPALTHRTAPCVRRTHDGRPHDEGSTSMP